MASVDLNDEKMFELVTDALRAGPGSPQWHQAMVLVRESGAESGGEDDHTVLLAARGHLERGGEYRSVGGGGGFPGKVMEGVEKEAAGRGGKPGLSMANIVTIAAVIVMMSVAGLILYFTLP